MTDVYDKIKEELKIRKVNIEKELIPFLGISRNGYYLSMSKKRLTLELFEKISEFLKVNPSFWFVSLAEYNKSGTVSILQESVIQYNTCKICAEKQATIEALKQNIKTQQELCESLNRERNSLIKELSILRSEKSKSDKSSPKQ